MKQLSDCVDGRDNNFNLLRLLAASMVLISHSYPLFLGRGNSDPFHDYFGYSLGKMSVDVFFVTSGFLITASLFRAESPIAFLWNRVLRIYPALFGAVFFCVFIIGAAFTSLSTDDYFSESSVYIFIIKNSTLLLGGSVSLPGVFESVPFDNVVNGSLWTLTWELRMYAILFLVGILQYYFKWFDQRRVKQSLFLIGVIATAVWILNGLLFEIQNKSIHAGLPLAVMFFIGSALYVIKYAVTLSLRASVIMLVILAAGPILYPGFFSALYVVFVPYIVFTLAYLPNGKIRLFNNLGDYSYGIYIYAFPVQQAVVSLMPLAAFIQLVITSFLLTLILAMISWHFIEKPMLKKKASYRYILNRLQSILGGKFGAAG